MKDILLKGKAFLESFKPVSNNQTEWVGYVTVLAVAIYAFPESVAFLPDNVENYVKGFAGLIALATGGVFVSSVKNKNVTGGTVPANLEAEIRVVENEEMESDPTPNRDIIDIMTERNIERIKESLRNNL